MSRPETPFQTNDFLPVAELLNKIWEKLSLIEKNQAVMKDKLLLLDNENRKRVEDIEKLAKHCYILKLTHGRLVACFRSLGALARDSVNPTVHVKFLVTHSGDGTSTTRTLLVVENEPWRVFCFSRRLAAISRECPSTPETGDRPSVYQDEWRADRAATREPIPLSVQ